MSTLKPIHERRTSSENDCKSDDMSQGTGTDPYANGQDDSALVLGKRETQAVNFLKIIVMLILLLSAALVSTVVYLYTSGEEKTEFNDSFDDLSQQIIDTVQTNAQNKLEAVGALALLIQAFAITTNQTWPFVTMPFFEEHVVATKSLTDAYGVLLFPIITNDTQRKDWEEYSINNRQWVNESYAAQRNIYGYDQSAPPLGPGDDWFQLLWGDWAMNPDQPDMSAGISNSIFRTRHESDPDDHSPKVDSTQGPYFPQWQSAAMSDYYQSTVNLNYGGYEDFFNSTVILSDTGEAVNGLAWSDSVVPGYITTMLYPIFDQFYDDKKEVAFIAIDILWEAYLERILPGGSGPIDVVIKNDFDQVFTFQIDGEKATFMGDGDLHDTDFDDSRGRHILFGEHLMAPILSPTYTGTPLHANFGIYDFYIYPTQQMKDQYVTKNPIFYTLIICFVFFFTSIVFIGYDCLVERRQKLVMKSAIQSDAIVSSLFPQSVKRQLYQKDEQQQTREFFHNETRGTGMMEHYGNLPNNYGDLDNNDNPNKGPPIAELYEETTIMFADIAGFTAWSSGREPVEVFQLLETLYGSFDKIAKRRGVFKVETIGDCYVAVTGIPKQRLDHAVAMAKFANEIVHKLAEGLQNLAYQLGPETLALAMRIGLHSGPVTAGVLRGEKARFQLFGDSVNTAARVESSGKNNRIHASSTTADLLIQAGKGHWVKPRADKIVAKGKGEMTTFWIEPNRNSSVISGEGFQRQFLVDDDSDRPVETFDEICDGGSGENNLPADEEASQKQGQTGQDTLQANQDNEVETSDETCGDNRGENDLPAAGEA